MQDKMLGAAHADQVRKLLDAFESVRGVATAEFKPLISKEKDRLTGWRARVAVVGQVKAGKSTFLGALVGQPGFLPSEVNPWTSVITNLHFGHPEDPRAGGIFHFFGDQDWQRIVEGDTKTRELAEELLPGFKSEVLARQVETMRARARKRLGRFYNVLLGREHRYDFISREILERYVCAGAEAEDPEHSDPAKTGRYSDITERADIYFPPGPFAVPMVFTDTPGVNDPFLVRDEFTCRALLQSDVFIMTLSAHQALTEVDLGLAQMLAAHKGKRIIIYINRIDELDNFGDTASRILDDVKSRVAQAVPDREIDVVIGSAYWAELARSDIKNPETAEAAQAASAADGMDKYLKTRYKVKSKDVQERLYNASGLRSLKDAINSVVSDEVGRILRDEVTESLGTITTALKAVHNRRLDDLRGGDQASDGAQSSLADAVRGSLLTRSEAAKNIASDLDELFTEAEADANNVVTNSWESFRRELDLIGNDFIDRRTDDLAAIVSSAATSEFEIDTLELRRKLEEQISRSYSAARERLDFVLIRTSARASLLLRPFMGETNLALDAENLPHNDVAPIFLSSVQTLMLELTSSRGWQFWKNSKMSAVEATAALKRIILAEFNPSIENLAVISHSALVERAAEAIRRLKSLSTVMVDSVKNQAEELDASSAALRSADGEAPDRALLEEQRGREIADVEAKIATLDEVLAEFSGFLRLVTTTGKHTEEDQLPPAIDCVC